MKSQAIGVSPPSLKITESEFPVQRDIMLLNPNSVPVTFEISYTGRNEDAVSFVYDDKLNKLIAANERLAVSFRLDDSAVVDGVGTIYLTFHEDAPQAANGAAIIAGVGIPVTFEKTLKESAPVELEPQQNDTKNDPLITVSIVLSLLIVALTAYLIISRM